MTYKLLRFLFCFLLPLGTYVSLQAQATNATLSGTVSDSSGAALAKATVVVKDTATGISRTVATDQAGRYEVPNLIPGKYEVTADSPGFSHKVLTGVTLQISQKESLPITLAVGEMAETVNVEGSQQMLQTETSENGTVIDNKKVVELPMANRQFYSLALLSPGAYPPAQTSTLGFRGGFNVAGATEETNLFTYNGVYDSSIGTQQPSYRPSIETIQEFKLLTGVYGAEYGKYSGAQIVVLEKQGSNSFHGTAYLFARSQATDAQQYCFAVAGCPSSKFKQNTFGGTLGGPIFKDKTFFFGGYEGQRVDTQYVVASTIPSNSMLNGIFPGTTTLYNPYTGQPLVKSADGTYDLHQIPQYTSSNAAQTGQALAAYYPSSKANAPGVATTPVTSYPGSNYSFSPVQAEKMDEFTGRVDHNFSAKDSLNGSYQEFHDPTEEPYNTLCGNAVVPNGGCHFNQIVHLFTLQESHIFSPKLLNTFTFGYNRFQMPRTPEDSALTGEPVLMGASLQQSGPNTGLPNLAPSGYATLGGPTNIPQNQWLNQWEWYDSINWSKGAHSFKFGLDSFAAITTELFIQSGRGAATFNSASLKSSNACTAAQCFGTTGNSIGDLLLGLPYSTSRNPIAPNVHEGNYSFYLYGMDDWKATPYLTLNLGMRYEFNAPAYDSKDVLSRFNPTMVNGAGTNGTVEYAYGTAPPTTANFAPGSSTAQMALLNYFAPKPTFHYLYNYGFKNLAPRLGFAWQPLHKESTIVKGGFGLFYNGPIEFNQYIQFSTQLPERAAQTFTATTGTNQVVNGTLVPYLALSTNSYSSFANQAPNYLSSSPGTYTLYSAQPSQPTPYIIEYSLGVQQALTRNMVLEAVYLGSKGNHLANARQINVAPPTPGTTATQAQRAFPQFGGITWANDEDASSFNSLQVKLQQTFHKGLSFLLGYTYGKSLDQNSGTGSGSNSSGAFQDPTHPGLDWGLSDFDVRHRIAFSPVWELPFGKGRAFLNQGIAGSLLGGFQMSGIFQYQTGRPFTVFDSNSNISGTFGGGDRPNLVPGQDPNAGPKTKSQWFNIHAFTQQPVGTFGNERRNSITGPNLVSLDMTLAREFPIFERIHGQVRVEAFNVPNHPNFFNPFSTATQLSNSSFQNSDPSNPSNALISGAYGQITQAYNPRELQGAIRIVF